MKTIHKSFLVFALLLTGCLAVNKSFANEPIASKDLSTKEIQRIEPVTPAEADFTDEDTTTTIDIRALAPVTPAEADFSDSI